MSHSNRSLNTVVADAATIRSRKIRTIVELTATTLTRQTIRLVNECLPSLLHNFRFVPDPFLELSAETLNSVFQARGLPFPHLGANVK